MDRFEQISKVSQALTSEDRILDGAFPFRTLKTAARARRYAPFVQNAHAAANPPSRPGAPQARPDRAITGRCGCCMLLGVYPVVGIILLIVFLLGVSFQMHTFWKVDDAQRLRGNCVY